MVEKSYRMAGDISTVAIAQEIAAAWDDLRKDPNLRQRLAESDGELEKALAIAPDQAIAVRNPVSGFAAEVIVVAFLPLAVRIATDVWEKIILPRIVRRFGSDALVEVRRNNS